MSKSGKAAGVKKILSHNQSFVQCYEWFKQRFAAVRCVSVVSNAEAVRMAFRDVAVAAIASKTAAVVYGLKIIVSNIEDESRNIMRFVVIVVHDVGLLGKDKILFVMLMYNVFGAVHVLLMLFVSHGVSMIWFELWSVCIGCWEYMFYVDIEGYQYDVNVVQAFKELGEKAAFFKNFGFYSVGTV